MHLLTVLITTQEHSNVADTLIHSFLVLHQLLRMTGTLPTTATAVQVRARVVVMCGVQYLMIHQVLHVTPRCSIILREILFFVLSWAHISHQT